jgi:predicted CXXCH cytochrome family protein
VHGRTDGYWDEERGPVHRKKCIQCHDPHAPAFGAMTPAPGPNTIRMGSPSRAAPHEPQTRNPLLLYRKDASHTGANVEERP